MYNTDNNELHTMYRVRNRRGSWRLYLGSSRSSKTTLVSKEWTNSSKYLNNTKRYSIHYMHYFRIYLNFILTIFNFVEE